MVDEEQARNEARAARTRAKKRLVVYVKLLQWCAERLTQVAEKLSDSVTALLFANGILEEVERGEGLGTRGEGDSSASLGMTEGRGSG